MLKLRWVDFNIFHYGCFDSEITDKFPETSLEDFVLYNGGNQTVAIVKFFGNDLNHLLRCLPHMPQVKSYNLIKKNKTFATTIIKTEQSSFIKKALADDGFQLNLKNFTANGLENYKIIGDKIGEKQLFSQLRELGDIKIVEKKDIAPKKIEKEMTRYMFGANFFELNEKQKYAIKNAIVQGLYDYPRKTSITQLSGRINMPKQTLHRHLQQAEEKIIKRLTE